MIELEISVAESISRSDRLQGIQLECICVSASVAIIAQREDRFGCGDSGKSRGCCWKKNKVAHVIVSAGRPPPSTGVSAVGI